MSKEFLEGCKSLREAYRRAPWAAICARCHGGYFAFATVHDFDVWRRQA